MPQPYTVPGRHAGRCTRWSLRARRAPAVTTCRSRKNIVPAAQARSSGPVMPVDFGFRSRGGRLYQEEYGEVPRSLWEMGVDNFNHEFLALRRAVRFADEDKLACRTVPDTLLQKGLCLAGSLITRGFAAMDSTLERTGLLRILQPPTTTPSDPQAKKDFAQIQEQLQLLSLSNHDVEVFEGRRKAEQGDTVSPWFIKFAYSVLCWALDVVFNERPIQRFWVLEVVARIPYFSYISMLHLYESLGWWRAGAELRKIHFAEEWNELHHLQIMESLGGDQLWIDRFIAQHAALVYYWLLVFFFMFSPRLAYNFSELVENHATDTYTVFAETNKELLQKIPPPRVAVEYYMNHDLYLFDGIKTSSDNTGPRRPSCDNLYDVFINIRDDEREHVKTMVACQGSKIALDIASKRVHDQP